MHVGCKCFTCSSGLNVKLAFCDRRAQRRTFRTLLDLLVRSGLDRCSAIMAEVPHGETGGRKRSGGAFSQRRLLRKRSSEPKAQTFTIEAKWLNDGTVLEEVADHIMRQFKEDGFYEWQGPGDLFISSMCSGCEFPLLTSRELNRVFADEHAEKMLQLHMQDGCDIDGKKHKFIKQLHYRDIDPDDHPALSGGPCFFPDATLLGKSETYCLFHKKICSTNCGDIVIIGFLCKDISRANPNHRLVDLTKQKSPGGSCDTWQSLLNRLDNSSNPPVLLIIENVDAIADEDDSGTSAYDLVMSELSGRGYEMKAVKLDTVEFGLPQRRRRVYFVGIRHADRRLDFTRQGVETFEKWEDVLTSLKMNPCDVGEIVLERGACTGARIVGIRCGALL